MQQCLIYDSSLRFSRATYGVLILIAFFARSQWLVLAVSLYQFLELFFKVNILTNCTLYFLKRIRTSSKESGELNFVAGATGMLLLVGFLFLYFDKFTDFAWIYILIVA